MKLNYVHLRSFVITIYENVDNTFNNVFQMKILCEINRDHLVFLKHQYSNNQSKPIDLKNVHISILKSLAINYKNVNDDHQKHFFKFALFLLYVCI